ncbi:MAG: ROK family protein [Byssovorax sp.]
MRTLSIDIGGTGIKAITLDLAGEALTERTRIETPSPATPEAVLAVIDELVKVQNEFDRVSVGFPGVVKDGVIKTAPNLDPAWEGFALALDLERRLGKPARVLNDAAVQGLGVVEGMGFEVVITLGTGMGCAVYIDGKAAGLELAHHPFRKGDTYEERLGNEARKAAGNKDWNKQVRRAITQLDALFNYRKLYIGGGNTKHLDTTELPANVAIVDNLAGLLGGIRLWR